MADETLSSGATKFYKILIWYLLIQSLAIAAILTFAFKPVFALVAVPTILLGVVLVPIFKDCTHVVATDAGLRVGRPGADKLVPYTQIRGVTTFRYANPKIVTVETTDGKIRFFPPRMMFEAWAEPRAAKLIRERAKL
jgi:hypothetical protein